MGPAGPRRAGAPRRRRPARPPRRPRRAHARRRLTAPGPDDPTRLVADGYDAIHATYESWAASGEDPARATYLARALSAAPPGAPVLDLGGGAGGLVTAALAERYRVIGVDVSPRSVAAARRTVPSAQFVVADMARVGFASRSFDLVTAFYSLIHVPRTGHAGLLSDISSWLRPGGHLIATMGAGNGGEGTEADWLGVPMHWSSWGEATNRLLVTEAGLTIVDAAVRTVEEDGRPVDHLWIVARRPT